MLDTAVRYYIVPGVVRVIFTEQGGGALEASGDEWGGRSLKGVERKKLNRRKIPGTQGSRILLGLAERENPRRSTRTTPTQ